MDIAALRSALGELCAAHLPEHHAAHVLSMARPAIRLRHTSSHSVSHLGGQAWLEPGTAWPASDRGEPLALLCVLDLAQLGAYETDLALPPEGLVNVFYDEVEQPWGFDASDRSGWRVLGADPDRSVAVSPPGGASRFASIGLNPTQTLTIPGWEEDALESVFPPFSDRSPGAEQVRERYWAVEEGWAKVVDTGSGPNHQVGGWPSLQQAPIWYESDVVSRGFSFGMPGGSERARQARSRHRERERSMLLQIDSDDEVDWMWGDGGTLYFTIHGPLDLRSLPDSVWMTLQCG